jgi:hypothetical protein
MTPDEYVAKILSKYAVPRGPTSPAERLGATVAGPVRSWAGTQLSALEYSGSYAKETSVRGISDVDVFVSLKADTTNTLKEIYGSLFTLAQNHGWLPRRQNVSIGVTVNGTKGDLVPGRVQAGYQNYHSLYLSKRDTWTQTNVALHIDAVRRSGRVREIRAIKLWKFLRGLDFPSLYLELFTIEALKGRPTTALADNTLHILSTIGSFLPSTRIEDPANTSNVLSDELSSQEKQTIAKLASASTQEQSWGSIIW